VVLLSDSSQHNYIRVLMKMEGLIYLLPPLLFMTDFVKLGYNSIRPGTPDAVASVV
jgi:hypothetical protein